MATVTAGGAVSAALGNIEPGWRGAWGAMLAVVVVGVLNQIISTRVPGLALLTLIFSLVVGTMATGALYRLALQANHPGDPTHRPGNAGIQWTAYEWRIFWADLLIGVIFTGAIIAAFIIWAIALGVMIATHLIDPGVMSQMNAVADPWAKLAVFFSGVGGVVNIVLLLAIVVAMVWLSARLILLPIASAEAGRVSLGAAWTLTRGAVWPIIATLIVLFLIGAALGLITHMVGLVIGNGAGSILLAMLSPAIGTPTAAGLVAYVYRAKHGPDPSVAQVFA